MLCCGSPGSTGDTTADPFQAGAALIPQPSTLVRGVHFCRRKQSTAAWSWPRSPCSVWARELALPESNSGGLNLINCTPTPPLFFLNGNTELAL